MQVQKSATHYSEAARDEITLLRQLREGDPLNARGCVRMCDSFEHVGPHGRHVCLVFEVLGDNLLALIKRWVWEGRRGGAPAGPGAGAGALRGPQRS